MKGIFKKLFLGLFFCALICAGFSKDVKADIVPTASDMDIKATAGIGVEATVSLRGLGTSNNGDTFTIDLYCLNEADAEQSLGSVTLQYSNPASSGSYWTITSGTGYKVAPDGNLEQSVRIVSDTDADITSHLNTIRGCLAAPAKNEGQSGIVVLEVKAGSEIKQGTKSPAALPYATLYRPIEPTVSWNLPGALTGKEGDYLKATLYDPKWFFEGEKYSATLADVNAEKKYLETPKGTVSGTHGSYNTSTHVLSDIVAGNGVPAGIFNYTYDLVEGITLSPDFSNPIAKGKKSDLRTIAVTSSGSSWTANDVETIVPASYTDYYTIVSGTGTGHGNLQIDAKKAGSNIEVLLRVTNGLGLGVDKEVTKTFSIKTPVTQIKFRVGSSTGTNYSATIQAGYNKDVEVIATTPSGETLLSSGIECLTTTSTMAPYVEGISYDDDSVTFEVDSDSPAKQAKVSVWYDNSLALEGYGTEDPSAFSNVLTATITVKNGSPEPGELELDDPVCVTQGMSVNLSRFISGYESKEDEIDISYKGDKATVSKKSGVKIKNATLTGINTGLDSDALCISLAGEESYTDKSDVKVYPKTKITINGMGGTTSSLFSTGSSSSGNISGATIVVPTATYHDTTGIPNVTSMAIIMKSYNSGKQYSELYDFANGTSSTSSAYSVTKTLHASNLLTAIDSLASGDTDTIQIAAYPSDGASIDEKVGDSQTLYVYKINLDGSDATYTVDGKDVSGYFYAVQGVTYKIVSKAKSSSSSGTSVKFSKWEGVDPSVSTSSETISCSFNTPRTLKAVYTSSSSSSSSSSTSKTTAGGGGSSSSSGEGLDDVPKTGETKTDIWILWTVLLVSILGAGFMIYRRFGVVNAIAQADAEEAQAVAEEMAAAQDKEKEDKLRVLRDLRDLK